MVATDRTPLFQSLASSSSSPSTSSRLSPHRPPSSKAKAAEAWHRRRQAEKQWDQEAARINIHTASLYRFVSNVRRAYLHSGPPPREYREDQEGEAGPASSSSRTPNDIQSFDALSHLTEEQKDQVDLHLKLALERSVQRLKDLMQAEEARQAAQPTPSTSSSASTWARLLLLPSLPATSLDSQEYSTQLAQHRQAITSRLGAEVKRIGERVGLMQEARARAREDKKSGGSGAIGASRAKRRRMRDEATGRTAAALEGTSKAKGLQGSTASFRATTAGNLPPGDSKQGSLPPGEEELTAEQVQLFASESSALTRTLQSDLAAVESVASTLATINELQTTLIHHLSVQGETIAHLADEAGEQRAEVEGGNKQLMRASERNRSANRLLGALLVGSGLGLLFLHVMD